MIIVCVLWCARCPPPYRDATKRNGCGTAGRPLAVWRKMCIRRLPDRQVVNYWIKMHEGREKEREKRFRTLVDQGARPSQVGMKAASFARANTSSVHLDPQIQRDTVRYNVVTTTSCIRQTCTCDWRPVVQLPRIEIGFSIPTFARCECCFMVDRLPSIPTFGRCECCFMVQNWMRY